VRGERRYEMRNKGQSEMWEETYGRVVSWKPRTGREFQERAVHKSIGLSIIAVNSDEHRK
jgi:hypothetical protein